MLDNWVEIIGLQLHSIGGHHLKALKYQLGYLQGKECCGGFISAKIYQCCTIVQYHGLQLHSKEG